MAAAREQQVGDVGARDQQHQRHGAEQDQHRRPRQAADDLGHRLHGHAPLLLERRILRVQLPLDRPSAPRRPGATVAVRRRAGRRRRAQCAERCAVDRCPAASTAGTKNVSSFNIHAPLGSTPITVRGTSSSTMVRPTIDGSAPKRERQKLLGDHHDVRSAAGTILLRQEAAAEQRRDAQHRRGTRA